MSIDVTQLQTYIMGNAGAHIFFQAAQRLHQWVQHYTLINTVWIDFKIPFLFHAILFKSSCTILPIMQPWHWMTSLGAVCQNTCNLLWSHNPTPPLIFLGFDKKKLSYCSFNHDSIWNFDKRHQRGFFQLAQGITYIETIIFCTTSFLTCCVQISKWFFIL